MKDSLRIAKALADGSRLRVVGALLHADELCVCQITEMLQLATATVSRHMSVLENAGVVESRKEGRWVYYRLAEIFPGILKQWLDESLRDSVEVQRDCESLSHILSCDRSELCRRMRG